MKNTPDRRWPRRAWVLLARHDGDGGFVNVSDHVVWLHEIGKNDVELVGGKGANLGELVRANLAVPPAFLVGAPAYRAFLEANVLLSEIDARLSAVDLEDIASLESISAGIKTLICEATVPDEISAAMRAAYEQLGGGAVAVRSSATAEDLADASFAGQQSTYLNVAGAQAVVDAVRACWASLFEARAIAYRARAGFGPDVAIAVVVQTMVQSDRSGIMFTLNPVTNDTNQIVIEAVFGLGEAAVSGLVTPDMYIVDKLSLAIVERALSEQDSELVLDPNATGEDRCAWRDVPRERRGAQKLSDKEIVELAELGVRVERHYGCPQDIEWGIEESNLYLLQARPVTTA
jgi:pyruvate,water dikinase